MTVDLARACGSGLEAARLAEAVRADNPPHVSVAADGRTLRIRVLAPSPASARATLEDLLACLQAAERASEAGSTGGRTDERGRG